MSSGKIFTADFLRSSMGEELEIIWGAGAKKYGQMPLSFKKIAEVIPTDKQQVEILSYKAMPLAPQIEEGQRRTYSKMKELWITNLYMQYFSSNYQVTWQSLKTLKSKNRIAAELLMNTLERSIALAQKQERTFASMFNNYDASIDAKQVFGDGTPLASQVQPVGNGDTFSNLADGPSDPHETAVENGIKELRKYVDTGGKAILPQPRCIYSGTDLEFDVARLLETEHTLGTDYNDKNIISTNKYLPEGHVMSQHLLNDKSFHIITDVPNGICMFQQQQPIFDMMPIPGTFDTEMVSLAAWVPGVGDKRSTYTYPRA